MARKSRDPFELRLEDADRQRILRLIVDELTSALDSRTAAGNDVDYWHSLYEQAPTRRAQAKPWPDAADLTSYLGTEKVDALHARIMRTIWSDPVWTVEGSGDASNRSAFVEEFHAWKATEERLQSVLDRWVLSALIEPRGLLEVSEGAEERLTRKQIKAKLQYNAAGAPIFDEQGQPLLQQGPDGRYLPAGPDEPGQDILIDERAKVRTGPEYRVLPYRDSVILPGYARDKDEIWGYGKRLWRRYGDLQRKAGSLYDAEAVKRIGGTDDRSSGNTSGDLDGALARSKMTPIGTSEPSLAEKELWELVVLLDLGAILEKSDPALAGERWYLVTVHLQSYTLLRLQHDDLDRSRFVPMILLPRPDRATEGFSLIGHKLITVIEEHTAWRNLAADRTTLANSAPIKRLEGALWDPTDQPFGPRAMIDVRSMDELQPMVVPDATAVLLNHIQMCERTAERLAGINDVAAGQVSGESRTLGEVNMATEQSFVRMDLIVHRCQEALEDLAQIRHAIWLRALSEEPDGLEAPSALLANLEGRGVDIQQSMPDNRLTAAMLQGSFRFHPRGSVETADPSRQQQMFVQFMQFLPMLVQAFPFLAGTLRSPQAARAMMRQALRVFKVENHQAFLGSVMSDWQQTQMVNQLPMASPIPPPPMPMGPPGMAPGPGGPPGPPPGPMMGGPPGMRRG